MQHIVSKDETSSTAKSLFNGRLVIFLCVKVLHFLLLHNDKMACEVDVTDLKDTLDPTELQICGVVGGISSMKKGKSASYYDGEIPRNAPLGSSQRRKMVKA